VKMLFWPLYFGAKLNLVITFW